MPLALGDCAIHKRLKALGFKYKKKTLSIWNQTKRIILRRDQKYREKSRLYTVDLFGNHYVAERYGEKSRNQSDAPNLLCLFLSSLSVCARDHRQSFEQLRTMFM